MSAHMTKNASTTASKGATLTKLPVAEQNIILKAKLRKLEIGDSVQYLPAAGGMHPLVKVTAILENQKNPQAPRLLMAMNRRGDQLRILETQVSHVIPMSKDEYPDLVLQQSA